jgi:hypothetical protein
MPPRPTRRPGPHAPRPEPAPVGGKLRFYAVWVANDAARTRGTALCWGPPRDTPSEASRDGKARLDAGRATVAFVVRFGGGGARVMRGYTLPAFARRVIDHLAELEGALARGGPGPGTV